MNNINTALLPAEIRHEGKRTIEKLLQNGGPRTEDYDLLNDCLYRIGKGIKENMFTPQEVEELIQAFGEAFSVKTMQGFSLRKPHGYAGDFEIIDKVYTHYTCPQEELANWDRFFHQLPATKAVRNRKEYFKRVLRTKCLHSTQMVHVLNVASGPSRDVLEFINENPEAGISFDCIELDEKAIQHSRTLLKDHLDKVRFINMNVLKYSSLQQYDLVWSAGLFDYFQDAVFVKMLRRFIGWTRAGGEVIVGNFGSYNPTREFMELMDWILIHRPEEHLSQLAEEAGAAKENISIGTEEESINLFLHIKV